MSIVWRKYFEGEADGPEERGTVPVQRIGADEMMMGKKRYRRCPAKGGKEPWYPNLRF